MNNEDTDPIKEHGVELENLLEVEPILSMEQIILTLIDENGIALKTRYPNPKAITKMAMMAIRAKNLNLPKTAMVFTEWIKDFSIRMVSLDGLSREELVKIATKSYENEKESLKDRLLGSDQDKIK